MEAKTNKGFYFKSSIRADRRRSAESRREPPHCCPNIVIARALTTTAAAPCLITVIPRELVALPLPGGAGTNLGTGLDGAHVFVLRMGGAVAGRLISTMSLLALDPGRECECAFSSGLEVLNPPLWLMTSSNPLVTCFPTIRLISLFGRAREM